MKKLDVSLHADEPLRAGLLRVADVLIENALDRIRCSTSDRAKDVHLVRVFAAFLLIGPSPAEHLRMPVRHKRWPCREPAARRVDNRGALRTSKSG